MIQDVYEWVEKSIHWPKISPNYAFGPKNISSSQKIIASSNRLEKRSEISQMKFSKYKALHLVWNNCMCNAD